MSGWTSDLLHGLAELLATTGVGAWRPTGVYTADETAITIGAMPPEPEQVICLASYPVTDMVGLADVTVGVQVRTRAGPDPRDVQDLDEAVYDQLHGLTQTTFGAAHVVQCYRRSSAALGQARDGTDRWERVSNYYLDAIHPTTHRPD